MPEVECIPIYRALCFQASTGKKEERKGETERGRERERGGENRKKRGTEGGRRRGRVGGPIIQNIQYKNISLESGFKYYGFRLYTKLMQLPLEVD